MTTLGQLKTMKDDQIQKWLRKINVEKEPDLVTALLGADLDVVACVTRNMSAKAKTHLLDDLQKARSMGVQETVIKQKAAELEKLF